jgi:translation initiation factor 1 (eIF-1/SUI1)
LKPKTERELERENGDNNEKNNNVKIIKIRERERNGKIIIIIMTINAMTLYNKGYVGSLDFSEKILSSHLFFLYLLSKYI